MITVFTKNNCPPCDALKAGLRRLGKEHLFTFRNVDLEPDAAREAEGHRFQSFPSAVVDGVRVMGTQNLLETAKRL